MRTLAATLLVFLATGSAEAALPTAPPDRPTVVLLHGLARSASSMDRMERALQGAGYRVCNIEYPSREHSIADLASRFVAPRIAHCVLRADEPLNFVTHSLGGIIVRELANSALVKTFGRVVMLGPPNHGSEVVDSLGDWTVFDAINGPAGRELGTSVDSVPQRLGSATFEVGVISGSRSINWINSSIIPGIDDGKVSVESAKLEGMQDFVVVEASHPFLMRHDEVIRQTIRFLAHGCFLNKEQRPSADGTQTCVPAGAPVSGPTAVR